MWRKTSKQHLLFPSLSFPLFEFSKWQSIAIWGPTRNTNYLKIPQRFKTSRIYSDLRRFSNRLKGPLWHLVSRTWPVTQESHYSESLSKNWRDGCTTKFIFLLNVVWIWLSFLCRDQGYGMPRKRAESLLAFWILCTRIYWRGLYVVVFPHKSSILWAIEKSLEKQVEIPCTDPIDSHSSHWRTAI